MKLPCLSALRTLAIALIATAVLPACDRDKPENLIAAAEESIAKHDNKTAIIHLKNALQKAPESAHGRYLLGRALLESGDAISAEKELRKAMEVIIRLNRSYRT
jgi:cytochrome c-type biogenesis protein CcmH/NrfG